MNTQSSKVGGELSANLRRTLRAGHAWPLGSAGGRLDVLHGRVWLTREGELDDHVVAAGETFVVAANGFAVVEAWDDDAPALVAWRPGTLLDRVSASMRAGVRRCWEIVEPAPRIGVGSAAALLAVVVGAALFGPVSDARVRRLASAALLHNSGVVSAPAGAAARDREGSPSDAGVAHPGRARVLAQEARRRPPVPA